ncbi:MAG: response regulator [Alphaproteobacteria bacterium]|nr:response regulator [Alphaproteobacteria bacterium]
MVVDDDRRLRNLLAKFLGENGFRVSVAEDAKDARAKLAALAFDLIVLDVMMPGESGLDLARDLRKGASTVPILMLTAMGESADRIAGLETGVDDYLTKPFEPRELLLRIGAILRRAPPAKETEAPSRVVLGPFTYDLARGELHRDQTRIHLTSGETQLLTHLASPPGVTYSRQALAEALGVASDRAIDVQVTRLRRKIEGDPRNPRYLRTVWGEGYVLRPD